MGEPFKIEDVLDLRLYDAVLKKRPQLADEERR